MQNFVFVSAFTSCIMTESNIIFLDVIIVSKKYMYALVRLKVIINCMYNGTTGDCYKIQVRLTSCEIIITR